MKRRSFITTLTLSLLSLTQPEPKTKVFELRGTQTSTGIENLVMYENGIKRPFSDIEWGKEDTHAFFKIDGKKYRSLDTNWWGEFTTDPTWTHWTHKFTVIA